LAKPSKAYLRIGEVAALVGVEPHVLRYWEREFRSIRPVKSQRGQRVYSQRDVERLVRVRDLLYTDGFTIAGAKKMLRTAHTKPEHAPEVTTSPLGSGFTTKPLDLEAGATRASESDRTHAIASIAGAHRSQVLCELRSLRDEIESFLCALSN
jgi:DNA-binding transcriptional MerR regulator